MKKHITPHYDIKAESTSCYSNKGFTGIEINGVRFANVGEMLRYMDKQRKQLIKAKEIILKLYNAGRDVLMCRAEEKAYDNLNEAINDRSIEQFLSKVGNDKEN